MDKILNVLPPGSLIVWAIILVLFLIIGIKLLGIIGKGVVILLVCIGCFVLFMKFFPDVTDPITDFIGQQLSE